ncbi:hypothetical protein [Shimazuella alba]|uniref:hypothetical protein n=1 Tax=Shimazuella alba TaxID=2690964 RepID=UPI00136C4AB6|nr:hypothetical protein [Shimazuella alba]
MRREINGYFFIWFIGTNEPLEFKRDEALIVKNQLDSAVNKEKKIVKIVLDGEYFGTKFPGETYNIYTINLEQISYYMYQNENV